MARLPLPMLTLAAVMSSAEGQQDLSSHAAGSVSFSADLLATATPGGKVNLFRQQFSGNWTEVPFDAQPGLFPAPEDAPPAVALSRALGGGRQFFLAAGDPRASGGACYVASVDATDPSGKASVTPWQRLTRLSPYQTGVDAGFGRSVAVSGNLVAVGAVEADWGRRPAATTKPLTTGTTTTTTTTGPASSNGAVYLFEGAGDTWRQVFRFSPPDLQPQDGFGLSVSLAGKVLAVGAPGMATDANHGTGAVYVFSSKASKGDLWDTVDRFWAKKGFEWFGFSVSLDASGKVLAAGAPGSGALNNDPKDARSQGAVQVWVQDASGFWAPADAQVVPPVGPNLNFGSSVSLSEDGSLLAVTSAYGAISFYWGMDGWRRSAYGGSDGVGNYRRDTPPGFVSVSMGKVVAAATAVDSTRLVFWSSVPTAPQVPRVVTTAPDRTLPKHASRAVLLGDTLALVDKESMSARLFRRSGAGAWSEEPISVTPAPRFEPEAMARSMALTDTAGADGRSLALAVGDPMAAPTGSCYIFRRGPSSAPAWTLDTLSPDQVKGADGFYAFGLSVGISGNTLAVGAWVNATMTGAVVLLTASASGWDAKQILAGQRIPQDTRQDAFGAALSLKPNTLAVGAPGVSAAYVYTKAGDGSWKLEQRLLPTDFKDDSGMAQFGSDVTLDVSGKVLAVAASYSLSGRGRTVAVYTRESSGWIPAPAQVRSPSTLVDGFGGGGIRKSGVLFTPMIRLSEDGQTLAVATTVGGFIAVFRSRDNWRSYDSAAFFDGQDDVEWSSISVSKTSMLAISRDYSEAAKGGLAFWPSTELPPGPPTPPATTTGAPSRKSGLGPVLITLLVVVGLAAGGAGAYVLIRRRRTPAQQERLLGRNTELSFSRAV